MFLRLPDTTRSDIVLKSEDSAPRIIIVPAAGWELDTPNRILASERAMCGELQAASKEVREWSLKVHGVEFQRGTSIDYLVVNTYSHTTKALLHAVTNPELVDGPTANMLCVDYPAVGRLFLLSESGCWDATALLPAIPGAELVRVVEPSGGDFFGRVVDFFRETFWEDLPITISIPPPPRKTSIPRQDAGPTGRDDS